MKYLFVRFPCGPNTVLLYVRRDEEIPFADALHAMILSKYS
jgi:hypothetical protein